MREKRASSVFLFFAVDLLSGRVGVVLSFHPGVELYTGMRCDIFLHEVRFLLCRLYGCASVANCVCCRKINACDYIVYLLVCAKYAFFLLFDFLMPYLTRTDI